MSLLTAARTDMTKFISDWAETVSSKRRSVSYGTDGIAVISWTTNITSTTADRQAISGNETEELAALKIVSTDKWLFKYDEDILVNDRIYLGADYYRVDYIKSYEDRLVAYTTKNGN